MADPEEIYQEVLSEEQSKGSSSVVAEGRAKAARQRAVEGSPHPKEAKWWPGSQPQFEGGEAAAEAPAEEEAPAEAEAPAEEEAPAAEPAAAPAAEVETEAAPPPAEEVAEPQELTRDQPPAPAEPAQPAAATAPQPAAAQAPAAAAPAAAAPAAAAPAAAAPAAQAPAAATATLPTGVMHGTPAGTRLRPEDAVSTDIQFDAQKALLQRRKMIDELVASGVPAVSVVSTERRGSGAGMLLLYLLIPLLAVGFLISNRDDLAGAGGAGGEQAEEGGGGESGGGLEISAANVAFDTNELTIPAEGADLHFVNEDTVQHNVAIYETEAAEAEIFVGEIISGGQQITYSIPAQEPGEYYFHCDVHPTMNGTATFQ